MRAVECGVSLFFCVVISSCSIAAPSRLEIPPTAWTATGTPLSSLAVRHGADKRPIHEHGVRKVLSTSWLDNASSGAPTSVHVVNAVSEALRVSGIATSVGEAKGGAAYTLEITFHHLAGSWSTGIESLALLLPALKIEVVCELGFTLRDRHGRIFLDERREANLAVHATPLGQPSAAAAELLGAAVHQCLEGVLPRLIPAVDAWWITRGLAPRREAAINPLPVPRSSTDR